jgi:hypothetical protein
MAMLLLSRLVADLLPRKPSSTPDQFVWRFWRTDWQWERFISKYTYFSLTMLHIHMPFIYHRRYITLVIYSIVKYKRHLQGRFSVIYFVYLSLFI